MRLGQWPLYRVLLVCLAWAVLAAAVLVGVLRAKLNSLVQKERPGAISFGLMGPLVPVLAPPFVFFVFWLVVRQK